MFQFRQPQINHYVTDVQRSVDFYVHHFGFVETFRTPDEGPPVHVELKLDGLVLGLAGVTAAREMHGLDARTERSNAEIALWTDDVDAAYATLIDAGAESISPPHDFIGVLRAAWIGDPDGSPVQIVMRKPEH